MKMNTALATALAFLLLTACADEPTTLSPEELSKANGKTDNGATSAISCSFDNVWLVGSSRTLEDLSGGGDQITLQAADRLEEITRSQILKAAIHLQAVEASATLKDVFGNVDGESVFIHGLAIEDARFDWVQLFLGDTEVGVVFDRGTVRIVAEIGDGDISGCASPGGEPSQVEPCADASTIVACHWDNDWFAKTSADLTDAANGGRKIVTGAKLDPVTERQLVAAAFHLEAIEGDAGLEEALTSADDSEWRLSTVSFDDHDFDWFKAHMGDTEVGVVFASGTTTIVAEIGDGDVLGCITSGGACDDQPAVDQPPIDEPPASAGVCSLETPWLTDTSADLWDIQVNGIQLSADTLDDVTRIQLLAAALQLSAIEAGGTVEEAFEAADDGVWNHASLMLEGQRFDWVQAWMGDTEVGVVFHAGTREIVAEIGDGDVLGCN